MYKFLAVALLVTCIRSIERKKTPVATIIEADHFMSNTSKTTTYNITDAQVNKSLVTTLQNKGNAYDNNVSITLTSGSDSVSCNFKTYQDLCVLPRVSQLPPTMKIECQKVPCDVYFTNFQAEEEEAKESQQLGELYRLDSTSEHTIVTFTCNNPDIKDYAKRLKIFSTHRYTKTEANNIVFALFVNNGKGHIFIDVEDDIRACTKMAVNNVSNSIKPQTRIKDFVENSHPRTYVVSDRTDNDLRIDMSILGLNTGEILRSDIKIELLDSDKSISSYLITNMENKTTLNINLVWKKELIASKSLKVRVSSTSGTIIINMESEFTMIHEIDEDEVSFFDLQASQQLHYRFAGSTNIETELMNDNDRLTVDKKCNPKCDIIIKAKQDVKQAGLKLRPTTKTQEYTPIDGLVTAKIREGDTLYYSFTSKAKKEAEISINSENVIVYVGDDKCQHPSATCSNYTGNANEPIYIESQKETKYYIGVVGLDTTRFTIRVTLNTDALIQLKDGQPFGYTLKMEDKVGFSFKVKEKEEVHFNLIAPLNTLEMYVSNTDQLPMGDQENLKSTEGDLVISKEDMNGTVFSILVKKANKTEERVPFKLVATTNNAIVWLQPSVSHYDKLQPAKPKSYLVNYKRNQTNVLNFFLFGTATVELLIDVEIGKSFKEIKEYKDLKIKTTQELLEMDSFASDLCSKDPKELCEMYVRLTNQKEQEIDIVLTHMVQESIIQLKDGHWQSFSLTVTTTSTHFYFIPRHQNKSISIVYNTTYPALRLVYKLWKTKDVKYDPSRWPFPDVDKYDESAPRLRHISVSSDSLKECWPDCIILMSLFGIERSKIDNVTQWDDSRVEESFSLLATNDILELMEHEKVELVLHQKEEKQIIIDLKYFMDKELITIFTYQTVGAVALRGCVSSSTHPRVPSIENSDFQFGQVETQITLKKVKKAMEDAGMENDKQIYIRIVIIPYSTSKISIEFSSKQDLIKQFRMDTLESVEMKVGEEKMFQMVTMEDYRLKIIRVKGFPFVEHRVCDFKEIEDCIDKMNSPVQLAAKTDVIEGKRESGKILVVKLLAKEPIEMELYMLSTYGSLELKEGKTLTDFGDKDQLNKYAMTTQKQKETVITVNVLEGNPTVKASTVGIATIQKTKGTGNVIHIAIPPHEERPKTSLDAFLSRFESYGLNTQLETVSVEVVDNSSNCYYTIGYNSGDRGVQLEDGLFGSALIEPGKNITFFYENNNIELVLTATLTFQSLEQLQDIKIKLSYGKQGEDSVEEKEPELPQIQKKTPHPTVVFKLPKGYRFYEILLDNFGKSNTTVNVLVNQDQIILLPYDMEYSVLLKPEDKQHLLVEVNNDGFLLLIVRKCDEGIPTLFYSFDYAATLRDEYQYEGEIKDEVRQEIFIKAKVGTLYLKFTVDVESVFSVEVKWYKSKGDMPHDNIKLGNQGIIDYQLIDSVNAQISFVPLSCGGKQCGNKVKYEYLASTNLMNLYSQLSCPSHFFTFSESFPPLKSNKISMPSSTSPTTPVKFDYQLIDQISYIGIRAVLQNGRQYLYKPIEIVTIWGHISRNKRYHNFVITMFVSFVLLCVCTMVRRRQRKAGYGELREEEDTQDRHGRNVMNQ